MRSVLIPFTLMAAALARAAPGSIMTHCRSFLDQMSTDGHSKFEIGALCRSRLPPDVCMKALKPLGDRPWSPETLDTTCRAWDAEFQARLQDLAPSRRAEETFDLMQSLDNVMRVKRELGVCKTASLEECAEHKAKEYPKATQKIITLSEKIYNSWKTGKPLYPAPPPGSDRPHALYEATAPVEAGLPAARSAGIFAVSGALVGAVVTAAALLLRRRQQHLSTGALLVVE